MKYFFNFKSKKDCLYDVYPLYWTKPVEGDFLCVTVMNLKENV